MKKIILCAFLLTVILAPAKARVNEHAYPETWLQYAPAVFMLSAAELGCRGGKSSEHTFLDRAVNVAFTYAIQTGVTYPLKWMIDEQRPDGSAWNSFPSGHSGAAFAGAEMIRMEYGWGWGTLFYASAVATATLRVVHKRHWWWDTVAGAVIGIGSAHLGRLCTDKFMIYVSPNSIALTYRF